MKMMMVLTVVGLLVEAIEKMNVCVKYNYSIDYFMRDYTQSQHLYYKSYIRIWNKKNNINNMTRSYICALNLWRLRVLRDECTFHILHVRVYIVFFSYSSDSIWNSRSFSFEIRILSVNVFFSVHTNLHSLVKRFVKTHWFFLLLF